METQAVRSQELPWIKFRERAGGHNELGRHDVLPTTNFLNPNYYNSNNHVIKDEKYSQLLSHHHTRPYSCYFGYGTADESADYKNFGTTATDDESKSNKVISLLLPEKPLNQNGMNADHDESKHVSSSDVDKRMRSFPDSSKKFILSTSPPQISSSALPTTNSNKDHLHQICPNNINPHSHYNTNYHYPPLRERRFYYIHDKYNHTSYVRGKFLGKGGFAKCYKFTNVTTNAQYAAKVITKSKLTKPSHRDQVNREIDIHKPLNHPNIVNLVNSFEDDYYLYIMLEYCDNKTLVELIKDNGPLSEGEARFFLQQILSAVQYLHNVEHILHRDLKLGNMFLTRKHKLKVGDFGLSSHIKDIPKKVSICGTPNYIAPEILAKKEHGFPADIWAIGCIMYAMLTGKPPFESDSLEETYDRIAKNIYQIPASFSQPARDLVKRLLAPNTRNRITLNEVVRHPFIQNSETPNGQSRKTPQQNEYSHTGINANAPSLNSIVEEEQRYRNGARDHCKRNSAYIFDSKPVNPIFNTDHIGGIITNERYNMFHNKSPMPMTIDDKAMHHQFTKIAQYSQPNNKCNIMIMPQKQHEEIKSRPPSSMGLTQGQKETQILYPELGGGDLVKNTESKEIISTNHLQSNKNVCPFYENCNCHHTTTALQHQIGMNGQHISLVKQQSQEERTVNRDMMHPIYAQPKRYSIAICNTAAMLQNNTNNDRTEMKSVANPSSDKVKFSVPIKSATCNDIKQFPIVSRYNDPTKVPNNYAHIINEDNFVSQNFANSKKRPISAMFSPSSIYTKGDVFMPNSLSANGVTNGKPSSTTHVVGLANIIETETDLDTQHFQQPTFYDKNIQSILPRSSLMRERARTFINPNSGGGIGKNSANGYYPNLAANNGPNIPPGKESRNFLSTGLDAKRLRSRLIKWVHNVKTTTVPNPVGAIDNVNGGVHLMAHEHEELLQNGNSTPQQSHIKTDILSNNSHTTTNKKSGKDKEKGSVSAKRLSLTSFMMLRGRSKSIVVTTTNTHQHSNFTKIKNENIKIPSIGSVANGHNIGYDRKEIKQSSDYNHNIINVNNNLSSHKKDKIGAFSTNASLSSISITNRLRKRLSCVFPLAGPTPPNQLIHNPNIPSFPMVNSNMPSNATENLNHQNTSPFNNPYRNDYQNYNYIASEKDSNKLVRSDTGFYSQTPSPCPVVSSKSILHKESCVSPPNNITHSDPIYANTHALLDYNNQRKDIMDRNENVADNNGNHHHLQRHESTNTHEQNRSGDAGDSTRSSSSGVECQTPSASSSVNNHLQVANGEKLVQTDHKQQEPNRYFDNPNYHQQDKNGAVLHRDRAMIHERFHENKKLEYETDFATAPLKTKLNTILHIVNVIIRECEQSLFNHNDICAAKNFVQNPYNCEISFESILEPSVYSFTPTDDAQPHQSEAIESNLKSNNQLTAYTITWVTKWVDYAERYGFGYQLSDGSRGVLFKDKERIYVADQKICLYDESNALRLLLPLKSSEALLRYPPPEFADKLSVYIHFATFMERNLVDNGRKASNNPIYDDKTLINSKNDYPNKNNQVQHQYVIYKRFTSTQTDKIKSANNAGNSKEKRYDSLWMILNDGTCQLNFLRDHIKMIFGFPSNKTCTLMLIDGKRNQFSIDLPMALLDKSQQTISTCKILQKPMSKVNNENDGMFLSLMGFYEKLKIFCAYLKLDEVLAL